MDAPARHLRLLTETIAAVNSTLDLEEVLGLVARKVAEALEADACFVYLYDARADELVLRATHGTRVEEMTRRPKLRPGEGITGSAAAERSPIMIAAEAHLDQRFKGFSNLPEDEYEQRSRLGDDEPDAYPTRFVVSARKLPVHDPKCRTAHQDEGRDEHEKADPESKPAEPEGAVGISSEAGETEQRDRCRRAERERCAEHVQEQREIPGIRADEREHQTPGFQIMRPSTANAISPLP